MALRYETLYMTIHLVDKFCCNRKITKNKYQLLAIACLFIAGKYEEIATPKMKRFTAISEMLCGVQDILDMESEVLTLLNFQISQPSMNWFMGAQLFAIASSSKPLSKANWMRYQRLCYYLLELVLFEIQVLLRYPPEVISCSVLLYSSMLEEFVAVDPKNGTKDLAAWQMKLTKDCSLEIRKIHQNKLATKYESVNNKYPDIAIPDSEL